MTEQFTVIVATALSGLRIRVADAFLVDGYDVLDATMRAAAIDHLRRRGPNLLVVSELAQPGDDARLLADVRSGQRGICSDLPIIAISRSTDVADRIRLLEAGADAVVLPDAGYLELRANVQAIRSRMERPLRRTLTVDGLRICQTRREVTLEGTMVDLTPREYALLAVLASEPDRVFEKDELVRSAWAFQDRGTSRTLDSHACRLRSKLEAIDPDGTGYIANIWGVGYCLRRVAGEPDIVAA